LVYPSDFALSEPIFSYLSGSGLTWWRGNKTKDF
jgi:hypothetical protein